MELYRRIQAACAIAGTSMAELARKIGTSPQNLSQKLKVGRLTEEEIRKLAEALGAEYHTEIVFPDGVKI